MNKINLFLTDCLETDNVKNLYKMTKSVSEQTRWGHCDQATPIGYSDTTVNTVKRRLLSCITMPWSLEKKNPKLGSKI